MERIAAMNALTKHRLRVLITLTAVLLLTSSALASSGGPYVLDWFTVDGGGGTSTGGMYSLSGTAGQADAGAMSGGTFTLWGGFWGALKTVVTSMYLPVVRK
jgi:hypothetical protein